MKIHWCQGDTIRNPLRTIFCWRSAHSYSMRWETLTTILYSDVKPSVSNWQTVKDGVKQHQQAKKMLQNQNTKAGGKEGEKRDVLEALLSQRRMAFLPWTVNTAEVFWSPHTQVYSPVSSTSRSRISSSAAVSSCLILYFSLGLSALSPFFHSTGTPTLLSSQRSVAVAPSVASLFFSPSLKNAGKAEGQQHQQWDVVLQRVKNMFKFPFPSCLNWFINTRTLMGLRESVLGKKCHHQERI